VTDPQPHHFSAAFAAVRSAIPSDVRAVNFYRRALPGVDRYELMMAFHRDFSSARAALDRAQSSNHFTDGVTFGRGLDGFPGGAWVVCDAFEESK
jgi:hypothetical protein